MWFFNALSWICLVVELGFCTLAIAAGLYYLAELVEEFTAAAAKVIKYLIWVTLLIYIGLIVFEDLPLTITALGIVSQFVHLMLLSSFPVFYWTSFSFIASIGLVIANHYLALTFFANNYYEFQQVFPYGWSRLSLMLHGAFIIWDIYINLWGDVDQDALVRLVMAYFILCLWLVPFSFFVSLSANDYTLPVLAESAPLMGDTFGKSDVVSNYFSKKTKRYSLLTVFNTVKDYFIPNRTKRFS